MRFRFLTYLVYSPRGVSEIEILSRGNMGACKNGSIPFSTKICEKLRESNLDDYFMDSALVPVPRSSLMLEGAVYPARIIAETFCKNGIGNSVADCLRRTVAIPKSSGQFNAETRNSVDTHLNSLEVRPLLISEPTIIIIDDILTLGRTLLASAIKLNEIYPEKEIKIFCPIRTRSFQKVTKIIDVSTGFMERAANGGVRLPD